MGISQFFAMGHLNHYGVQLYVNHLGPNQENRLADMITNHYKNCSVCRKLVQEKLKK